MNEHKSFLQDDDDDTLLFEKLQGHVLEKHPNPERIGCIDRSILESWVYKPEKLDLWDPKYLHVLKCAECTRELMELRQRRNEQTTRVAVPETPKESKRGRDWRWAGLAAVLLCGLGVIGVSYWRSHWPAPSSQAVLATPVAETIDLSQAGTIRGGESSTVPPVVLPRRVVTAHVILPYYSPGGNYVISITPDRTGGPDKAEGRASANVRSFHADLTVTLDLRNLQQGTYFLATTHEGDRASYFYPLSIR